MTVGERLALAVVAANGEAFDDFVTWASGDESVVTVDADGMAIAVSKGSGPVTASTEDGRSAVCSIKVSETPEAPDEPVVSPVSPDVEPEPDTPGTEGPDVPPSPRACALFWRRLFRRFRLSRRRCACVFLFYEKEIASGPRLKSKPRRFFVYLRGFFIPHTQSFAAQRRFLLFTAVGLPPAVLPDLSGARLPGTTGLSPWSSCRSFPFC